MKHTAQHIWDRFGRGHYSRQRIEGERLDAALHIILHGNEALRCCTMLSCFLLILIDICVLRVFDIVSDETGDEAGTGNGRCLFDPKF